MDSMENTDQELDYIEESEDETTTPKKTDPTRRGSMRGEYVSMHSSGFRDFLLKPELLRSIADCGFEHPSEVQHECIPQAILSMDVLCQAKSGMGKTAVFVLATLQQLEPVDGQVSVIVLAHIRELAFQIADDYRKLCRHINNVKVAVFFGGIPIKRDEEVLSKNCPHIVIGTPGRILALARKGALKLGNIRHFVLDECDKMLEVLGMRKDVQEIFKMTPHEKQVMMFSATLGKESRLVCKRFMQDPLEIYVDDCSKLTLHGLRQFYVKVSEKEKTRQLMRLLDALEFNQVIIFVKSVQRCRALTQLLMEQNFPAITIHSAMPQEERLSRYKQFKDFEKRLLVATNLFGRGMDIVGVNIVFNYDMAEDADTFLHRCLAEGYKESPNSAGEGDNMSSPFTIRYVKLIFSRVLTMSGGGNEGLRAGLSSRTLHIVARAGRFGTKGMAITFISNEMDAATMNEVQARFEVNVPVLPEEIDTSSYLPGK